MVTLALGLLWMVSAVPQNPDVAADSPPQPVDAGNFAAWRSHLQPSEDELRWRQVPWHDNLADGLADASVARKPLLLWLMNGHPLGCT